MYPTGSVSGLRFDHPDDVSEPMSNAKPPETASAAGAAATALATAAAPNGEPAKPAVPAKPFEIARGKVVLREAETNDWFVKAGPPGATLEDMDGSEAWAPMGMEFHPFDRVEMVTHDRTTWGEFIVLDCGPGFADLKLLRKVVLPPRIDGSEGRLPAGFRIRRAGPADIQPGWLVERLSDGRLLNYGTHHHRREDAVRYLLYHATVRQKTHPRYVPCAACSERICRGRTRRWPRRGRGSWWPLVERRRTRRGTTPRRWVKTSLWSRLLNLRTSHSQPRRVEWTKAK
jgi:hypothetical protein